MDIYGDLRLDGTLQSFYDEVGTGGTGGSGDDLYYHHISNHYHDGLPSLINIKTNDGNLSIDNSYETILGNRFMISKGESQMVNMSYVKSRPNGNTGVIIGGIDSLRDMEFINIAYPSNSYHFGELYANCYDCVATSNGPLDKGVVFNWNGIDFSTMYEFSIKTGVDVAFFGYIAHSGYRLDRNPSVVSNRTLDDAVIYTYNTYMYTYGINNKSKSVARTASYVCHEYGGCGLSNSEGNRGLFVGGTNVDTTTNTGFNNIEYITISTPTDVSHGYFGSLGSGYGVNYACGCSNGALNRGLIIGGQKRYWEPSSWKYGIFLNTIDQINISVLGNSDSFGELSAPRYKHSVVDNNMQNRSVIIGGNDVVLEMEYVTISTTGNSLDFGDLTNPRSRHTSTSNG